MGKKYDARKMTELCDTIRYVVEKYASHAEMLENEYEIYNSNNTYRGEAADASKEFVYKGQGRLTKEQVRVLTRLSRKFNETQNSFSSMVDSSPNAKIDTDVIEYDKRYFERHKESFEERAYKLERVTREMADKFERFGYITSISCDRARYGFEDMCGYSGFMNKCLRKFEEFDEGITSHLKRSGIDSYMYDLEKDTKATMNALDGMTVYNPDVKTITVTPIAQMASKMMYSAGLIPMQQSLQKLSMKDKTLPGCNALVANRTREIFLNLCRNVELGLYNVRGPQGAINALGKMGNNNLILPFGTFEAHKSLVVQKIMCSAFYKDYKNIAKNSLADYVRPVLNTVNKGADILSDIGQSLDDVLKGGAHKFIDAQPDNILYYRVSTGGTIALFEVGGAIQSYVQTGTLDNAQKNAIENYKSFQKGGTNCIIDMVTGLFSLPKLIIDDSRNTRPAVKFVEYLKKNGVSNIPEDIAKFCNETKESAKAIGGELDQKVADMEVKDWYQAAGYITVFVASFFTGGKAVKGAKAGEAGEAAGAAEGLSKVEKVEEAAEGLSKVEKVAGHADDVANLEKLSEAEELAKAANGAEEVSKLDNTAKTVDNVAEGAGDLANTTGKSITKSGKGVWDMPEGGGTINGREYSQHALERMAPDTPSVRAKLSRRAEKLAESKGLKVGTPEHYQFCQKYVDPRNIPPSVIEDAISNTTAVPGHTAGTFVHQTADVTVIVNETGKVVTVIPK